MAFTDHGHQIPGTTAEPRPENMPVARCGGPGICNECSAQAAFVLGGSIPPQPYLAKLRCNNVSCRVVIFQGNFLIPLNTCPVCLTTGIVIPEEKPNG